MKPLLLSMALLLSQAPPCLAALAPQPGSEDPRIQTVLYDPDQVVVIHGALRNEIMLEFGPGERLQNVAIGDSLAWQVTPNKNADLLFLKPLSAHSATNMTVVTTERRYAFELQMTSNKRAAPIPYIIRFTYPAMAVAMPIEPAPARPPDVVNTDYVMSGTDADKPVRIFDDGHRVYFQWSPNAAIPAIFAFNPGGGESLVNYVVQGDYVVVEQMAAQFLLRNGKAVTTVTNRAFAPVQVGEATR